MNKPAQQGTKLPWHQDFFHFLDPYPMVTVWMAMDASTIENGCVQVLPGSQRHFPEGDQTVFLEEEQIAEVLTHYTPEYLECAAGEGLLLHNRLLHRSAVNTTDTPRRAFSACYMNGMATSTSTQVTAFSPLFGAGALQPDEVGCALQ